MASTASYPNCFTFLGKLRTSLRKKNGKDTFDVKRVKFTAQEVTYEPDLWEEMASSSCLVGVPTALSLSTYLPPRVLGFTWKLVYSTNHHGFSLATLYKRSAKLACDLPMLLFIRPLGDVQGVFGAYLSCGFRISEQTFGDSSTFVFKCGRDGVVHGYKWNAHATNSYFLHGTKDFCCVGASNGRHALWLDGNLDKGRSEECDTFSSPPLTPTHDFRIKALECWTIDTC